MEQNALKPAQTNVPKTTQSIDPKQKLNNQINNSIEKQKQLEKMTPKKQTFGEQAVDFGEGFLKGLGKGLGQALLNKTGIQQSIIDPINQYKDRKEAETKAENQRLSGIEAEKKKQQTYNEKLAQLNAKEAAKAQKSQEKAEDSGKKAQQRKDYQEMLYQIQVEKAIAEGKPVPKRPTPRPTFEQKFSDAKKNLKSLVETRKKKEQQLALNQAKEQEKINQIIRNSNMVFPEGEGYNPLFLQSLYRGLNK